jgi:hypothetical protein
VGIVQWMAVSAKPQAVYAINSTIIYKKRNREQRSWLMRINVLAWGHCVPTPERGNKRKLPTAHCSLSTARYFPAGAGAGVGAGVETVSAPAPS